MISRQHLLSCLAKTIIPLLMRPSKDQAWLQELTFQEPNLKVQGPLAPPQIGALSNDVLQSQEQSGTSLTTTGLMTQAVQGADVAHQTGIFLANSCHTSFQYSAPKLSLLPRARATSPASSSSGTGAHTLCVNKLRQYWCVCYIPGFA